MAAGEKMTAGQDGISEIVLLETEAGCSCCASQICGCEPRPQGNRKIFELNERQRRRNIVPQCDKTEPCVEGFADRRVVLPTLFGPGIV